MKKLFYLIIILSLFVYCVPKQDEVERIMEDGVDVVINHLEPYKIIGEPSNLILEEVFTIDTEKADVKKIGLTNIWNFDVDSEENIYMLSYKNYESKNCIFKFDRNGNFVTSFGQRNQELNETGRLSVQRINNSDEIVVPDIVNFTLVIFSIDGSLLREIAIRLDIDEFKVDTVSDSFAMEVNQLESGNHLIQWQIDHRNYKYDHQLPLILYSSGFDRIKELGRYIILDFTTAEKLRGIFPVFTWSISDGKIFLGTEENGYEINVYDSEGDLVRKIKKMYKPVKVPDEYKKYIMKMAETVPWGDKIYFPEFMPPFQYIFTDDERHLFVMTYEKGEKPKEYIYDIFNPDGIFIGRISLGNYGFSGYLGTDGPLEVKAKNNRIYCLRENESGYHELVVYKMKWE